MLGSSTCRVLTHSFKVLSTLGKNMIFLLAYWEVHDFSHFPKYFVDFWSLNAHINIGLPFLQCKIFTTKMLMAQNSHFYNIWVLNCNVPGLGLIPARYSTVLYLGWEIIPVMYCTGARDWHLSGVVLYWFFGLIPARHRTVMYWSWGLMPARFYTLLY